MTALPALHEAERAPRETAGAHADARPRRLHVEQPQAPFRRPPVVRRHRRRRALTLLRLLAQAMVIVGLPTAAVLWALTSPQFDVREIRISPSDRVPAAWVEAGLAPVKGENLLRLSLAKTRGRIEGHPWLASVSLRKRLPDGLEVAIFEKTPVAVLETADPEGQPGEAFVDPRGEVIAPVKGGSDVAGLPRIRGAAVSPRGLAGAIAAAGEFEELGSPWGGRLESIEILGPEDFRLTTEGLPFPLVVRRGSLEDKHEPASRLIPEILARFENVNAVDLRFAQRIVLQPEPGGEELIPPSRPPSRG